MDKIYTVKEAAKILSFSTNTLYKYLEEGTIKAARGAGQQARFRIPHSSLEEYLGSPLDELQVLQAINPAEYAKRQEFSSSPALENSTVSPSQSPQAFPLLISRLLILTALIFIVLDLVLSQSFTLTTQLFRMGTIAVFVLLAYQFGGYTRA